MSQRLVSVVHAVRLVDSLKRKPERYEKLSFFSEYDIWKYIPIFDDRLCDECLDYAASVYFAGNHLRGTFKYLEIRDEDTVEANVHPHCRCLLVRLVNLTEYIMVTKGLFD